MTYRKAELRPLRGCTLTLESLGFAIREEL
jgi:hypothetical protein